MGLMSIVSMRACLDMVLDHGTDAYDEYESLPCHSTGVYGEYKGLP